jgi:glucose 1-dehydrogenase
MAPPQIPEVEIFPVLRGKVALITGAAQGIGKATASLFLKAGAKVVICDIQAKQGQKVADELTALGEVYFTKADISSSEDVAALIAFVVRKFGRLDCAVNNAALTPDDNYFVDFDEAQWNRIFDVNVKGTALCVKHQMNQFHSQGGGGSIVVTASTMSWKPQPRMPSYGIAKHALLGLVRHASMEGGPHNIRVNAIAPGAIWVSSP